MTLVERFTRLDDDTLEYTFTVSDPDTWASDWTASMPMQRTEIPLFEYACHEGNYSMEGILSGHRADERRAAEAAVAESRSRDAPIRCGGDQRLIRGSPLSTDLGARCSPLSAGRASRLGASQPRGAQSGLSPRAALAS